MAKYIVEESNYKKYEKNYLFPFINLVPGIVWSIPLHQKWFPNASWWMTFGLCCICSTVLVSEFKTGYCSNTLCGRSSNVYSFVLGIC